jgi:hypothetical protein
MMAFVGLPGLDHETHYQLVIETATDVVYRAVSMAASRSPATTSVSPDKGQGTDPYVIRSETTLRNLTDKASPPMRVAFSLGTAAPNNALDNGLQLTTEFWNGKDQVLTRRASSRPAAASSASRPTTRAP